MRRLFFLLGTLFFLACSGGVSTIGRTQQQASKLDEQQLDGTGGAEDDDHGRAFSFVVIGCNRVDVADVSPTNPSTANLEQLGRTYREIAQLDPLPRFLFFAGDMVYGYSDASVTESQLAAWRSLYESSSLPSLGVELVPIPGNHESQGANRLANLAAEEAWLRVMEPYTGRGGNGPQPDEEDGLSTDQSRLTYSFNYRGTHFLILSTDPVGRDWRVPVRWIQKDLEQASARQAEHIFAIGHKPAFPWPESPLDDCRDTPRSATISGRASKGTTQRRCSRHTITSGSSNNPTRTGLGKSLLATAGASWKPASRSQMPTTDSRWSAWRRAAR